MTDRWHDYRTHNEAWRKACLISRSVAKTVGAEDTAAFWAHEASVLRRLAVLTDPETEINGLRAALNLALCILGRNEPLDSRAVSDEFVAMAAVQSGTWDSACLAIIEQATARVQVLPPPEAPEITVTTE